MVESDLKNRILKRIDNGAQGTIWTPSDFLDLASRDAVDKALQRLVRAKQLRRIDRGLYDQPSQNPLTKRLSTPDYRQLIAALARRDQVRMLIDGMTAANDLGLTTAVPAHVVIHTDARRRSIRLDNLTIEFKVTAPSKLYWAGRPAMRIVQALYWLKDLLANDRDRILGRLSEIIADPTHGVTIREDLRAGVKTLPAWMQGVIRELLAQKHAAPGNGLTGASPDAETAERRPNSTDHQSPSCAEASQTRGVRRAKKPSGERKRRRP
jgi:hypothetical protein